MTNNTPKVLIIDLENNTNELRSMNNQETQEYNTILQELETVINNHKTKVTQKEIAIAKLVALGLTEEDIRAVLD